MEQLELYILLFIDSLVSNFAFNIDSELAFYAMNIFGSYNAFIIIFIASFAFIVASMVNYWLGRICYNILVKDEEAEGTNRIRSFREFNYLPLILTLSAVPFFGKFIVLFSGFCKVRFGLVILLAGISKIIYYSYVAL